MVGKVDMDITRDIKFSVIMPAYNAEKYIAYAIDSVLAQTYSNFELIIVNDGSTDKTEDIVKQYSDKDTRIILVSQENSGCAGAARNTALKYVTGDYIQILDADDYFEKNMFAEYAAKLKEREYDIILPDCIFVDEGGEYISAIKVVTNNYSSILSNEEVFELSLDWKVPGHMCVKASILKLVRYDVGWMNSDELTTRKLFASAESVAFAKTTYFYRQHTESTTKNKKNRVKQFYCLYTDYGIYKITVHGKLSFRIQRKTALRYLRNFLWFYSKYKEEKDLYPPTENKEIHDIMENALKSFDFRLLGLSFCKKSIYLLCSFKSYVCFQALYACIQKLRVIKSQVKSHIKRFFIGEKLPDHVLEEQREIKKIKAKYKNNAAFDGKRTVITMFDGFIAGGLCDRLRGVVSLYQTCKERNIDFFVYFISPFNLEEFMVPNTYNWIINKNNLKFDNKSKPVFLHSQVGNEEEGMKQRATVEKTIQQDFNQFHFYTNAHYSLYSDNYSQCFKELFKPSEKLQNELNKYYINEPYISVSFRFLQLLNDFEERYINLYNILPAEERNLLIKKSLQLLKNLYDKEKKLIFVATDSKTFLAEASQLPFVFIVDGEIAHVDATDNSSFEANKKTFIDFYMIADAAKVYLAHSGQMHYSGFPKNAALLSGKEFEVIEY